MRKPVMPYAISAFVIRCLDSIIPLVSISEISSLCLASMVAQAVLVYPGRKPRRQVFSLSGSVIITLHSVQGMKRERNTSTKTTSSATWAASWQNQQNDCAPSEDSDQHGHPPSLIRVFICARRIAKDPSFLHADSEDSESSLGAHAILLVLSWGGSHVTSGKPRGQFLPIRWSPGSHK